MIEVIIPNWNGLEVLPRCLESLSRQTFASFTITVVDNGSLDSSPEYVREYVPDVRLLRLSRNYGFCKAVNEGIQRSSAPWCAVLNNDVEADPYWLEELYRAVERHPYAFVFASKILQYRDPSRIESAGDMLKADACGANRGRDEIDQGQYETEEEVFSASAAAALYRRSLFDIIGLFDERFFAYFEDIDLGFRAQRFGLPCIYVPRAKVYHRGKHSRYGDRKWHLKQEFVNSTICQIKNVPLRYMIRNARPVLVSHLKSVKGLVTEGNAGVLIEAEKELIRRLPHALVTRLILSLRSRGRFDRLAMFLPDQDP